MANSRYEYVRSFEQPDNLLANTWIVVRIDGRGFSKLTTKYKFVKPNDKDALDLMNAAAEAVMKELPDLVLAYGNSDEYSFVFHKDCVLFERRASKLTTTIVSTFTSYYVFLWSKYFPDKPLTPPLPSFDGRAVCYPSDTNLKDYMSWRQADCHINNLYNTTFWNLVQRGGMGAREAEQRLSGTVSSDKNEILFKEFGINYNNEQECFKKGTVLYRDFYPTPPAEPSSAPTQILDPSTPLVQPEAKRAPARSFSKPFERIEPDMQETVSSLSPDPGPTFLSTASIPSPSPSPTTMFEFATPNPLRSHPISPRNRTWPLSPPSSIMSPCSKHSLRTLTPLPLSPPILLPSNHPPLFLNAPNPTTRDNFSPISPSDAFSTFPTFPIPNYSSYTNRYISHSASASVPLAGSSKDQARQRSPSLTTLPVSYFSASDPPVIPMRLSSIPHDATPRKLSLQSHRSATTSPNMEKEVRNLTSPYLGAEAISLATRKISLPLRTNKALPSPPMSKEEEEEVQTRDKVVECEMQGWHCIVQDKNRNDYAVAELPAASVSPRLRGHARFHSAPVSTQFPSQDTVSAAIPNAETEIQPTSGLKDISRLKSQHRQKEKGEERGEGKEKEGREGKERGEEKEKEKEKEKERGEEKEKGKKKTKENVQDLQKQKAKVKTMETKGHDDYPGPMSRRQKEKDRKKRRGAAIVIEHVDVIREEFWEKRPWILSGKAG